MDNDKVQPNEQAAANRSETASEISHRMFNPKLAALRAQHPFVPIMPLPNAGIGFTLAANTAVDIRIPSGTKMLYISGSDEYYVSRNGNAALPIAVQTIYNDADYTGSFQNPSGVWLYVEEIHMLSFIAPNAGTRISVQFWSQT